MNEFLVWHKLRKEFVQPYRNIVFDNDGICENDLCDICNYIGLNDIDGKKIYADSSIVEFEYGSKNNRHKKIGVYVYDKNIAGYYICDINNKNIAIAHHLSYPITNIKIIDTIQENKLGLIKGI